MTANCQKIKVLRPVGAQPSPNGFFIVFLFFLFRVSPFALQLSRYDFGRSLVGRLASLLAERAGFLAEGFEAFMTTQSTAGSAPRASAIAGVFPPTISEATIMTVWPSVGATSLGQWLGRLFRIRSGCGPITVGRLALLASMPLGLMLYLSMRLPWAIRRYRLTNRRVLIERGINPRVEQYVDLDRFDAIDLVVNPGQEWYASGDLVFRRGPIETLRLPGVSRPESFRQTCLKVRQSYVGVAAAQAHLA